MSQSLKVLYVYIWISFIYLGFFSTEALSQFTRTSYPYFTQHFIHPFTVNPAFVGDASQPSVGLGYRAAPRLSSTANIRTTVNSNSTFAYAKGIVPALNDGGIGIMFSNNSDTYTRNAEEYYDRQYYLGLSSAYTFNLADLIELKGGVTVGYLRSSNYYGVDPITNEQKQKVNIDIGIMIDIPYAKIGVARHHNKELRFDFFNNSSLAILYRNEIFITIDGDIPIQDIIKLKPSIIAQMERQDMLTQYSLMGEYNNMVFAGVSFSKEIEFNRGNQITPGGVPVSRLQEYHPLRFTLGGKVSRFLAAATYGISNQENRNALFEISLGYFLDDEGDY